MSTPSQKDVVPNKTASGAWLYLIGDGNIVNIACADGHPAEIMDTSFALQALNARYLIEHCDELEADVYDVPDEIDQQVAQMKLASMQISIDTLTDEQRAHQY